MKNTYGVCRFQSSQKVRSIVLERGQSDKKILGQAKKKRGGERERERKFVKIIISMGGGGQSTLNLNIYNFNFTINFSLQLLLGHQTVKGGGQFYVSSLF